MYPVPQSTHLQNQGWQIKIWNILSQRCKCLVFAWVSFYCKLLTKMMKKQFRCYGIKDKFKWSLKCQTILNNFSRLKFVDCKFLIILNKNRYNFVHYVGIEAVDKCLICFLYQYQALCLHSKNKFFRQRKSEESTATQRVRLLEHKLLFSCYLCTK